MRTSGITSPKYEGTLQEQGFQKASSIGAPFLWTDEQVMALVEKVAKDGKRWRKHRETASPDNRYHGMSKECMVGDRMKDKWALLKRYPRSLIRKSKPHYDLFISVERSNTSCCLQSFGNQKRNVSPLQKLPPTSPILPEEPVVRRVTPKYKVRRNPSRVK